MNFDNIYTYDPNWFKSTSTSLQESDLPLQVKPLPFFWWLNPWKHMKVVFDDYNHNTKVANEWRDRYHQQRKLMQDNTLDTLKTIGKLKEELAAMKSKLNCKKGRHK